MEITNTATGPAEALMRALKARFGTGWLRGNDTKKHMGIAKKIEREFGAAAALDHLEKEGLLEPGYL